MHKTKNFRFIYAVGYKAHICSKLVISAQNSPLDPLSFSSRDDVEVGSLAVATILRRSRGCGIIVL
jgi:hypothetical protein